jgi:hypothetical protein
MDTKINTNKKLLSPCQIIIFFEQAKMMYSYINKNNLPSTRRVKLDYERLQRVTKR